MNKRYLAIATFGAVFLLVASFFVTYLNTPERVPTEVEPTVTSETDPLVLQGRIWELETENEGLEIQVLAYEDMVATAEEKYDWAIDHANALEEQLKTATRPIIVEQAIVAQTGSQGAAEASTVKVEGQPPLIPDWNQ